MLSVMRRGANSWVMVLLFAAIIFVFALNFGPWAGNVGGNLSFAVDVNGRVIGLPEFQAAYSRQFQMIQSYRTDYTTEQAEAEGLKALVLDQLISKELLAGLAREHGLSVSDDELALFIKERLFGSQRPFDRETYRRLIYSNFQATEAQFEAQLRRDLLAERMVDLLGTGLHIPDGEVQSTFIDRYTRVSLDVVKIEPSLINIALQPTQEQAKLWAKDHPEEIAHYYNQHISEFRQNAKEKQMPVHQEMKDVQDEIAKRILKEKQQKETGKKYADALLADLKKGVPADRLTIKGNEKIIKTLTTGFFRRDSRFVPQVGKSHEMILAAFSLNQKNPVSNLVFEIDNAFYLVKLKDKEEPDMKNFEKEREAIRSTLLSMRKQQLVQNYVAYLKKQASIKYNEQLAGPVKAES